MSESAVRQAVIGVIRSLGFVGNAHYCPGCLNEFHADRGQHKPDCSSLAEIQEDSEWWRWRDFMSTAPEWPAPPPR